MCIGTRAVPVAPVQVRHQYRRGRCHRLLTNATCTGTKNRAKAPRCTAKAAGARVNSSCGSGETQICGLTCAAGGEAAPAAEVVESGQTTLAVAEDVDRSQVHGAGVVPNEASQVGDRHRAHGHGIVPQLKGATGVAQH